MPSFKQWAEWPRPPFLANVQHFLRRSRLLQLLSCSRRCDMACGHRMAPRTFHSMQSSQSDLILACTAFDILNTPAAVMMHEGTAYLGMILYLGPPETNAQPGGPRSSRNRRQQTDYIEENLRRVPCLTLNFSSTSFSLVPSRFRSGPTSTKLSFRRKRTKRNGTRHGMPDRHERGNTPKALARSPVC